MLSVVEFPEIWKKLDLKDFQIIIKNLDVDKIGYINGKVGLHYII